jgi:hypothetical protein
MAAAESPQQLAPVFEAMLAALPHDWSYLELDLRIGDDSRYVETALLLVTVNPQAHAPAEHDWHWRICVAHHFGHAAAPEAVHGALRLLDEHGIAGELALREVREGRVEVVHMWGRPESVRREFDRLRSQ